MPYRFHKLSPEAEYLEPAIDPPGFAADDIAGFIHALEEPSRSICSAVVLQGDTVSQVAAERHLSHTRVSRILRSSLRPLANELGWG